MMPPGPSVAGPGLLDSVEGVRAFCVEHLGEDPGHDGVEFLAGGVSSIVALVRVGGESLVVKQALPALRVAAVWESRPERALIEARAAETQDRLVPGSVPRVRLVVPDRNAFVMEAAPAGSEPWKAHLMRGNVRLADAQRAGRLLGRIHARSAAEPTLADEYADRSFFEELRVDPYLRRVAIVHPAVAPAIGRLVAALEGPGSCLVHGDFSPKNLLVTPGDHLLLIDHEVAHWGVPAFDVAFVLAHLCLKAVRFGDRAPAYLDGAATVLRAYRATEGTAAEASGPLAGSLLGAILLARIDGKSPVEYLDDAQRGLVRALALDVLTETQAGPAAVFERVEQAVTRG
jgi:aminoglycoside phosphotransferase (APT) family kinase protein